MNERFEKRSVTIPTFVWDINMQCKKDAEIHIVFDYGLDENVLYGMHLMPEENSVMKRKYASILGLE